MGEVEQDNNIVFESPPKKCLKSSFRLSQSEFLNSGAADLSLSIREKYQLKHISLVHELIACAREKKSEIEDLLRMEENKAELEELE
jgi:hypothetical protein